MTDHHPAFVRAFVLEPAGIRFAGGGVPSGRRRWFRISRQGKPGQKDKDGANMPDYKDMYYKIFNAATDFDEMCENSAQILLEVLREARQKLRKVQRECEELYISSGKPLEFPEKGDE